jgi:hypothetical protein
VLGSLSELLSLHWIRNKKIVPLCWNVSDHILFLKLGSLFFDLSKLDLGPVPGPTLWNINGKKLLGQSLPAGENLDLRRKIIQMWEFLTFFTRCPLFVVRIPAVG